VKSEHESPATAAMHAARRAGPAERHIGARRIL
jgi:hypothetical protein